MPPSLESSTDRWIHLTAKMLLWWHMLGEQPLKMSFSKASISLVALTLVLSVTRPMAAHASITVACFLAVLVVPTMLVASLGGSRENPVSSTAIAMPTSLGVAAQPALWDIMLRLQRWATAKRWWWTVCSMAISLVHRPWSLSMEGKW